MARTKLVRLSDNEYTALVDAQKKLIECGINSLPEEVRKEVTDFDLGSIAAVSARMLIKCLEKEKN